MTENCFMQNKKNFKVDDKIGMFKRESLKILVRNRTQEQERKNFQWSKIKMTSQLTIFLPIKIFRKNNNMRKKKSFHLGGMRERWADRQRKHTLFNHLLPLIAPSCTYLFTSFITQTQCWRENLRRQTVGLKTSEYCIFSWQQHHYRSFLEVSGFLLKKSELRTVILLFQFWKNILYGFLEMKVTVNGMKQFSDVSPHRSPDQ